MKLFRTLVLTIILTLALGACGPAATPVEAPTPAPIIDCPTVPAPTPVSFNELWESSAHADEKAEAFIHWDDEDPQEIPVACAGCHSRTGFLDLLGVDGTTVSVVDFPAKTGTTITCYVCHNEGTLTLDNVIFPSGERVGGLGSEARCITCHQGRASTETINTAISDAEWIDDDTPSADLAFVNSHSTSGATPFGTEAKGAYEYNGKSYQGRFVRGGDFFTCIRCHDQHSLEVRVETCSECHTFDGVDVRNIRVNTTDFDGDSNTVEGIAFEIEQIHTDLYAAIQAYAKNIVGVRIVYDPATHPYFFTDTNNNGLVDPDEINPENKYTSWTPRLLRAAYNYNYAAHDLGAFAHNSRYIIQVLYDSLADLGGDTSGMARP